LSDEAYLPLPESFARLYRAPGGQPFAPRFTLPARQVHERHEFCEDLAQMLVDTARDKLFELGVAEEHVLERIALGLLADGAPVDAAEARWVVTRLAELLGWPAPAAACASAGDRGPAA
jgi:hypothetical protein